MRHFAIAACRALRKLSFQTTLSRMTAALEPSWDMGDRMRKALRESPYTVGEMASYLGVGRSTLSRWFSGTTKPTVAIVRLWALRTGVPFEWLGGDFTEVARPKGFEPPTSWLVAA